MVGAGRQRCHAWGLRFLALAQTAPLRQRKNEGCTRDRTPQATAASLAEALKEELFQLEIERSLGTISRTEYASAKQALEETVKRALARAGAG